jgi:hypothetical protein
MYKKKIVPNKPSVYIYIYIYIGYMTVIGLLRSNDLRFIPAINK